MIWTEPGGLAGFLGLRLGYQIRIKKEDYIVVLGRVGQDLERIS